MPAARAYDLRRQQLKEGEEETEEEQQKRQQQEEQIQQIQNLQQQQQQQLWETSNERASLLSNAPVSHYGRPWSHQS